MKKFIQGMYMKKNFRARLIAVILSVIVMGFALSWLVLVDMGTDPCTTMNLAISKKLGMSVGNWQAMFNILLFVLVIFFGRGNIGFGTIANMFLVGYSLDFFSWLWEGLLPAGLFDSMAVRLAVLFPALALFVLSAGVYMDVDLGTAPYDAIPFMAAKRLERVPFRVIRMCFDFAVIIIGFCLGGNVGIVTILMGFTLGPVITWVGHRMERFLRVE